MGADGLSLRVVTMEKPSSLRATCRERWEYEERTGTLANVHPPLQNC